ncbi:CHAT domain-containing protein [uncultured Kriegella sp.]|uniref:CHAT domain-containing protein n=1 Tax=uncultured Kriegella sp. TaxID=1798910 RepID=UPI0030D8D7B4|tara:strand:+ start:59376 stop:62258 length:2883 start_codon:yes stop_codon:yes gene_type:complete
MKYIKNIVWVFLCGQVCWSQGQANIDKAFEQALNFHYVNKDSTYFYYEKTIALATEQGKLDYVLGSLSYLINANSNFYDLRRYRRNLQRMDSLLSYDERVDSLVAVQDFRNRLLFDKGNFHYKLKEYAKAQKFFLILYAQLNLISHESLTALDIDTLSAIYSFLGLIYNHTGRFEQAEFYYKRDLEFINQYKDSIGEWQSAVFNTKKLLSQVYEKQGKTDKANELLEEALQFYRPKVDNPRFKNNFLSVYILLAKNYIKQGNYDAALAVLEQNDLVPETDNPFLKEINVLYADTFLGKESYDLALENYEKSLKAYQNYRQNLPHQDVAEIYGKIAKLYLKQHKFQKGLDTLKKAFASAGNTIKTTTTSVNLDPEEVFSKIQFLDLLDIRLQLLTENYTLTNSTADLKAAVGTSRHILKTFDLLKVEFESKLNKQYLIEDVYPIFHRMMGVAFMAYQKEHSPEVLELALNIAEKNKDFVLLEALRNTQATEYGDVPQQVLDKEAQLRAEITHIEKEIFDTTGGTSEFSDQLFTLKQQYYGFLDTLKQKYPKYHNLKYGNRTIDFSTIRNTVLNHGNTMISFTMTDNYLYAIVLNNKQEDFMKLPFSEADRADIRNFYSLISKPTISGSEEKIAVLGGRLFDKILKEPLKDFKASDLTIIPDGELHYLPFDLLRENGSYLLKTKRIGYGNSVASLSGLNEKKSTQKNKVLAFAPSFNDAVVSKTDRQFGKLLYNADEVAKIGTYYNTQTVIDEKATLANFLTKTSNFNIFHMATHASANDEYPDYSYLAFSQGKDSSESNILYIKDLYNTTLGADMVTLSACQTGIGKLQKGQGMLSLSKGFYYAGAKSLVNTLWKINDKSSAKLMGYFYEGLSNGLGKSEALRKAKLKYLASTDDDLLKHPYYWAAFVVSGDVSPISADHFWEYTVMGIMTLGVLLLYIVGRRNFFRRNRNTYNIKINMKR